MVNMKVLLTQPKVAAQAFAERLTSLGYQPIIFPTIEIIPTPHQDALLNSVKKLSSTHMLIFTSKPAVHFGMQAIQSYWGKPPQHLQFAAIGPGSKKLLHDFGISEVLSPPIPPFESESLLSLPQLNQVKDLKIMLLRGNGGRDLLKEVLTARESNVEIVECYQRQRCKNDPSDLLNLWQEPQMDAIISTCPEGLFNLFQMLEQNSRQSLLKLLKIPLVVVSQRMWTKANNLGFEKIITALGASEDLLLMSLSKIREELK